MRKKLNDLQKLVYRKKWHNIDDMRKYIEHHSIVKALTIKQLTNGRTLVYIHGYDRGELFYIHYQLRTDTDMLVEYITLSQP